MLAGALVASFFFGLVVNLGMVSGLLPVVGVPLPMVSYGGTAMVSMMIAFGMLMAISTERPVTRATR
jgi:rod shape determining protein RodA